MEDAKNQYDDPHQTVKSSGMGVVEQKTTRHQLVVALGGGGG